MKIIRVTLTKEKLAAMPERERTLLLLLGHAANEINVLCKLILTVRKEEPASKIVSHVEAGQAVIFLRLLVGKLHEAWLLFQTRVQSDRALRDKFIPNLPDDARAALTDLNKHFGQGSPLTAIRNRVSFHYTDDDNLTETHFQQLGDDEPWEYYLGSRGNTFYYASELVMSAMAAQLANDSAAPISLIEAFSKLCDVAITVTRNLTCLFDELIAEIISHRLPTLEGKEEEIPEGPKLSEFCLPYFFAD